MNHLQYVAEREAREPAFRAAREELRPEYEFRRALIAARLRAGLTQAQVAERLGITRLAIARLESGTSTPTVETLRRLADALAIRFEIAAGGLIVHSAA